MDREGSMGDILVLGFVIFIAGFLAGLLAILMIPVSPDVTSFGVMYFILGFTVGIIVFAFVRLIMKSKRH
ncbi:MAG: hypothetical protein QXM86_00390 [Candidatus Bathyarchaeia archaeon]